MQIKNVTNIFCCDTYALVLLNGTIRRIGNFAKNLEPEDTKAKKIGHDKNPTKKNEDSSRYLWDIELFDSKHDKDSSEVASNIKNLSLSPNHVVALTKDYLVYSWGFNTDGMLGIAPDSKSDKDSYFDKPQSVDEINNFLKGNKNRLDQY